MNERPFLIPALLIAAAAVPLILGLVPRNRLYGVRTPRTLSADRIWYPANRLGGVAVVACYTRSLGRGEP
jgi:uncharacterized membrane protein